MKGGKACAARKRGEPRSLSRICGYTLADGFDAQDVSEAQRERLRGADDRQKCEPTLVACQFIDGAERGARVPMNPPLRRRLEQPCFSGLPGRSKRVADGFPVEAQRGAVVACVGRMGYAVRLVRMEEQNGVRVGDGRMRA